MGNFNRDRGNRNRDRSSGGGFDRRGSNRGFNRGGGDRQMHKVICDACHKPCEVPFKPSNDKPIYCNDCFSKQSAGKYTDKRNGGYKNQRPHFEDSLDHQSKQNSQEILKGIKNLNYKLDELLKILKPKNLIEQDEIKPVTAKKIVKKKTTKKKIAKKKTTKKKK